MFRKTQMATAAICAALLAQGAHAAVTADEAKLLGSDKLTEIGAEKAGNKDGSIPAYTGKAPKAPASYDKSDPGQRPDPYGDKPKFSINAQNYAQHADKLDAMVEIFKKYPDFRMDVYPTRRDFSYPKYVLDNTVKNATSCKGLSNELKLEGCYGGFPFPIPKTGNQAMWNHLLQFSSHVVRGETDSSITTTDGKSILQSRGKSVQQYDYYAPQNTKPNPTDLVYWKLHQSYTAPARQAGQFLVLLDNLDMVDKGRRAYQYIPGQRRVKLAPNLAYDTPTPGTGGASTMDDAKGFLGALDRFDFKLIGKKEKYIMYNNFNMANHKACPDEKLLNFKYFPNPECVRWELHRVWVVEATLKPGLRHIYQKRTFFWDEDAPGAGSSEHYDASGKLYRMINQMTYPWYEHEGGGGYTDTSFELDLQTGTWVVQGASSKQGLGWFPSPPVDNRIFSPESMAGEGVR